MQFIEWVLTPSKFDETTRPLAVHLQDWDEAVRLSRENGYSAPESGGMTRDAVRCFAQALRRALHGLDDDRRELVGRLVRFLENDGRGGFTQARQWMSWRRAITK